MEIDEFNTLFEQTLDKLSDCNKEIYLLGDFDIDLLKVDDDNKIDEFYNLISSNFLIPHITLPTRITATSRTLIDNIYSNNQNFANAISGNLTASISDHLPQFIVVPKDETITSKKQNVFKCEINFDKESLIADFINTNWDAVLSINQCNPNVSFDNLNNKVEEIVNKHLPLKKLSKKELRIQAKPWITRGIRSSMKRRDRLLNKIAKTIGNNCYRLVYDLFGDF